MPSPAGRTGNKADNKVPFARGRYLLSHRLGNGSFGDIFEGFDTVRNCRVAVKLEKKKVRYPQLEYESKVYRVLHQPPVGMNEIIASATTLLRMAAGEDDADRDPTCQGTDDAGDEDVVVVPPFLVVGIPQIFYYDSEGDYNIMVMELCGPSLEDLFNYCHRRFSLKTVLMIAEQMLHRMQYIHERGFVHRDIKPENFTFGAGKKAHLLYIIDFGLSKLYWDCRKNTHIPFVDGKPLTGTARYCSANTHRGFEQSRRDDLESVGFLLVYFLKGSLPWQGIQAKDQQLKTIRIGEKKIATTLEDLCKGLPSELLRYCQYCRELSFQQKPDYDYLRGLFRAVGQRYGYLCKPPVSASLLNTSASHPNGFTPKDCGSYPDSHGITASLPTAGQHEFNTTSHKNASGTQSPAFAAQAALSLDKEPDPKRGFYDWQFDWFTKREGEVHVGLELQQELMRTATNEVGSGAGLSSATAGGALPSVNPGNPPRSRRRSTSSSSSGSSSGSSASPLHPGNQPQQHGSGERKANGAGDARHAPTGATEQKTLGGGGGGNPFAVGGKAVR